MRLFKINNQTGLSHIIVPILVVLVIGAVGTYVYANSRAASTAGYSTHCHNYVYGTGNGGRSIPCVADLQQIVKQFAVLQNSKYFKYSPKSVVTSSKFVDGNYGANTMQQVENYQAAPPTTKGGVDGVVGKNTWAGLCYWAKDKANEGNTTLYANTCK